MPELSEFKNMKDDQAEASQINISVSEGKKEDTSLIKYHSYLLKGTDKSGE